MENKTALIAFTGKMFSGKDFVAEKAGFTPLSVASPIYELVEYLTGFTRANPEVPGVRRMWQQIGQWGWGDVSEGSPMSVDRALLTSQIRMMGARMTENFKWVDWTKYGRKKTFWIDVLLSELQCRILEANATSLFDSIEPTRPARYAITNCRFEHEFIPLKKFGFAVFHVLCSEETRQERMLTKGYKQSAVEANDISEQLAKDIMKTIPDTLVIWSDDKRPVPEGKCYLTVDAFCEYVGGNVTALAKELSGEIQTR